VAPVNIVAICDVERKQLSEAAAMVSQRLKSDKTPLLYNNYRKMLLSSTKGSS